MQNVTNEVSGGALAAHKISRCVRDLSPDPVSLNSAFAASSAEESSLVEPAKLLELTFGAL